MSRFESITIREVESSDLETFYEHQLDPEAIRMAAFVCKDPKDKVAFGHLKTTTDEVVARLGKNWDEDIRAFAPTFPSQVQSRMLTLCLQ